MDLSCARRLASYFIVLVVGGWVLSIIFFSTTCCFINWRALSLTSTARWGLFIDSWDDLPVEAVIVWLAVAYRTITVFEAVKLCQASGLPALPAKEAFVGLRERPAHR